MLDNVFETKETSQDEVNNLDEFYHAVRTICKFCDYRFACDYNCPLDPIIKVVTGEIEDDDDCYEIEIDEEAAAYYREQLGLEDDEEVF